MDNAQPTHDKNEAELLRAARRGDQAAFAALYRLHAKAIHSLVLRLSGSVETAEDITQDTFLKAMRFLPGLRAELPLRPWLKRTAPNALIDQFRKQWRSLPLPGDDFMADAAALPESDAEIAGLLRRLPPAARSLVWLHLMEGWSHKELAARFGHTESWSKSLLSRALKQLRTNLSDDEKNSCE